MASVNSITLIGHLGKDPEIRYLPSGDPVASFSLATTETWKDKSGAKQERTSWHRVEVLGSLAKIVQDYCTKGKQVFLVGTLNYDEWQTKEGEKKTMAKVKLAGPRAQLVLLGGGDRGERREPRQEETQSADDFQVSDDDVPF